MKLSHAGLLLGAILGVLPYAFGYDVGVGITPERCRFGAWSAAVEDDGVWWKTRICYTHHLLQRQQVQPTSRRP